ncbi:MAG TPA: hypothetical protein DCS19_05475 [Flavobacterium sp.]|nr:hypothetical protein [Flavobacterium sp.]
MYLKNFYISQKNYDQTTHGKSRETFIRFVVFKNISKKTQILNTLSSDIIVKNLRSYNNVVLFFKELKTPSLIIAIFL